MFFSWIEYEVDCEFSGGMLSAAEWAQTVTALSFVSFVPPQR